MSQEYLLLHERLRCATQEQGVSQSTACGLNLHTAWGSHDGREDGVSGEHITSLGLGHL